MLIIIINLSSIVLFKSTHIKASETIKKCLPLPATVELMFKQKKVFSVYLVYFVIQCKECILYQELYPTGE